MTILDEITHSGEQLYRIEYKVTGGTKKGYIRTSSIEYTIDGYKPTQIATLLKETPTSNTKIAAIFDASQVIMPYTMRYANIGARYFEKGVKEENLPNYVGSRNNIELLENIGEILYNKKWYQITAHYGGYYLNDNRYAFDHTAAIPNKYGSVYYPFKGLHEGIEMAHLCNGYRKRITCRIGQLYFMVSFTSINLCCNYLFGICHFASDELSGC